MTRFAQRFEIEREVGAGGMARVFLARDEVLDRPVAIKVLSPDLGGTDIAKRFRREGRTAARLSHPNIVQVYDAGEDEFEGREVSYIVMEYVSGGDLKNLIDREGSISNVELARIGAEVSSGLAHAHERGVIHRDVKPHNILLDEHGRPKLTDFGIARALGVTTTPVTRTGSYLGTALYSSPEQLRGEKVTPKSDVYSLGTTLYQAAVGEAPFTGTPIEVASQHVNQEPDAPNTLGAGLSDEVEALILECVDKDPDRRPTAEEVHERLLDVAEAAREIKTPPLNAPAAPEEVERPRASPQQTPPPNVDEPPEEVERTSPRRAPPPGRVRRESDRRWRGRPVLLVAAVLLLAVVGLVLISRTLGGGPEQVMKALPRGEEQANSPGDGAQYAAVSGGGSAPESGGGGDPGADAAQTVVDYFEVAASENYQDTWDYLSPRYQQELEQQVGSREAFTDQFQTLERIEYTQEPTPENVSENTATVSLGTTAYHTNRIDSTEGTVTLVREDGEWKIDELDIQEA